MKWAETVIGTATAGPLTEFGVAVGECAVEAAGTGRYRGKQQKSSGIPIKNHVAEASVFPYNREHGCLTFVIRDKIQKYC
ncbi:hypothetical protein SAMN04488127_2426 [Bhargavaea ginsengi]|uniref:Uncharacterized protein n=1 Tax=Bhargavaea ginsengi TaxID=426757 RepID=A0A1H7AVL1_9BACL|nr:hypothetical protein SAMN04488127_2426 [Bhargavaea ginsengi]